ncbi:MAG: GntR family transcriptional regulator [Chloroflexota bacterium]|nr:GntR family transcriptional regulator [Chloroflexota bacterium]
MPPATAARPSQTLEEEVYGRLRRAIVEGRLSPGQEVKVATTALEMGVSRIPIMKACRRLVGEGFLVANPRRRVTVRSLTEGQIEEGKVVLLALECAALEQAAHRLTAVALARLETLNDAVRTFRREPGSFTPNTADQRFHEALWQAAGMPYLLQQIRLVYDQNEPARTLGHRRPDPERSAAEHAEIIQSLRAGDVPAAQAALRRHRERGTALQIDVLRTMGREIIQAWGRRREDRGATSAGGGRAATGAADINHRQEIGRSSPRG